VVARQQNQRHQNCNAPLLLRREQYLAHGVAISAKVQQHQSGSTTCGGIRLEKKKRQKKFFFIYGTTFKKNESGRDFQRGQIWNDRSQKQKKNYGSHPIDLEYFCVRF